MGYPLQNWVNNCQDHYPDELTKLDLAVVPEPLGWVAVARIYIRKRDGEVNEVEIEVVETPVLELFLRQCLDLHLGNPLVGVTWIKRKSHMVMGMECIPELKDHLPQSRIRTMRLERQNLGGDDYMPVSLISTLFRDEELKSYTYLPVLRSRV